MDEFEQKLLAADPAQTIAKNEQVAEAAQSFAREIITEQRAATRSRRATKRFVLIGTSAGAAMLLTAAAAVTGFNFNSIAGEKPLTSEEWLTSDGRACAAGVWALPQEQLYDAEIGAYTLEPGDALSLIEHSDPSMFDQDRPESSIAMSLGLPANTEEPNFSRARFDAFKTQLKESAIALDVSQITDDNADDVEKSAILLGDFSERLSKAGIEQDENSGLLVSTRCEAK